MSLFNLLDNETPEQAKQTQQDYQNFLSNINKTKFNTMENLTKKEAGILSKAEKIEIVNSDLLEAHYLLINNFIKYDIVLKNLKKYPLPKVATTEDFENQMKYTLITLIINGEI